MNSIKIEAFYEKPLSVVPCCGPAQKTRDDMDILTSKENEILVIEMNGGVKNRAAKLLNLNRTTLVEKLKRLNITDGWID